MTKGERNKLIAEEYQKRVDYCKSKGIIIKTRKAGYDEVYNVYLNGVNLKQGACWDYHENALTFAEQYILENNL